MIDHTLLTPDTTSARIAGLCAEAHAEGFANVCVNPSWVALAVSELGGSQVGVCTVVDFPLGAGGLDLKREATRLAVADGAAEIDMVMAIGRLKQGDDDAVRQEIEAVVDEAAGALVKVILETPFLDNGEIDRACRIAMSAGAAYVKTSTGVGSGRATLDAVRQMRAAVGEAMGVKAAGGIRDAMAALAMLDAGASRLGTSASVTILQGFPEES